MLLNLKFLIINLVIIILLDLISLYNKKSRRTTVLEPNDEFFKICFLKEDFYVDGIKEIEQFDVVQVLGKKGDVVRVRRSDGRRFNCPVGIINDEVEVMV